jgi:hypothetical protein
MGHVTRQEHSDLNKREAYSVRCDIDFIRRLASLGGKLLLQERKKILLSTHNMRRPPFLIGDSEFEERATSQSQSSPVISLYRAPLSPPKTC